MDTSQPVSHSFTSNDSSEVEDADKVEPMNSA